MQSLQPSTAQSLQPSTASVNLIDLTSPPKDSSGASMLGAIGAVAPPNKPLPGPPQRSLPSVPAPAKLGASTTPTVMDPYTANGCSNPFGVATDTTNPFGSAEATNPFDSSTIAATTAAGLPGVLPGTNTLHTEATNPFGVGQGLSRGLMSIMTSRKASTQVESLNGNPFLLQPAEPDYLPTSVWPAQPSGVANASTHNPFSNPAASGNQVRNPFL